MDNKFTVTFYDDDKVTVLERQKVNRGESVKYTGKTPEKPAENGVEYTFVGWETVGDIKSVMENLKLFAKYEESTKISSKDEESLFELIEINTAEARLNEILEAKENVSKTEKATRKLSVEQKKELINEIKEKGSVNLDKQYENERD